jgi:hypothetical protein
MSNAVNQMKNATKPQQQATQTHPNNQPGAMVKPVAIPALKALEYQLDTQKDNLKDQARQLVQTKMGETREELRDVVADELAAIAGADDFFGFGSMFDAVPILEPVQTDEHPAGEQTIDAPALAVVG